jgi:hypothetical protein
MYVCVCVCVICVCLCVCVCVCLCLCVWVVVVCVCVCVCVCKFINECVGAHDENVSVWILRVRIMPVSGHLETDGGSGNNPPP